MLYQLVIRKFDDLYWEERFDPSSLEIVKKQKHSIGWILDHFNYYMEIQEYILGG